MDITRRSVTQPELVQRLRAHGCSDVTVRRIAIWRKNDVLPQFDIIGRGLGREHGGRQPNGWTDGDAILNQALWVYRLLKNHSAFVDLYLPLWLLGFPIPLNRIREGLAKPLETITKDATFEIDGRDAIEDYIDDAAYEFSEGVRRANWNVLDLPTEALAAILNVLLNSAYNLEDEPFEYAVESVGEWEQKFQQKCLEFLNDSKSVSRAEQLPSESGIFRHARFINDFLSVPHLRQVVKEATDADLMAVLSDISLARDILVEGQRLLPVFLQYVPREMQPQADELADTILSVGRVSLWIDLSLRRSGYGELIGYLLNWMLTGLRAQSTEDAENLIRPYGEEINSAFTMMVELGKWLAEDASGETAVQLA